MTREEAVVVLQKRITARYCSVWEKISETTFWAEPDEVNEALELAISALREQEELESKLRVFESSGWISVEERLPEPPKENP